MPGATTGRSTRTVLAAAGALVIGFVGWLWVGAGGTSTLETTRPSPTADEVAATASPSATSTSVPGSDTTDSTTAVAACSGVAGPSADVDGDGCAEPVHVEGTAVTAGGVTFDVGRLGDRIAVGDWDCDGLATPGIVRPSTGEVFLFAAWAGDDRPVTVDPVAVVPGAADLESPPEASPGSTCRPPTVRLADDTSRPLDAVGPGA